LRGSDYDREKLQERLAKLAGGVATINVGGVTETPARETLARSCTMGNAYEHRVVLEPFQMKKKLLLKIGPPLLIWVDVSSPCYSDSA
jgi:hypothetical protein